MPEILPPVLINNGQNIVIPSLYEGGNQIGPLFQTGTQGPPGSNTITSSTQSNGTAIISISGLTIGNSLTLNGQTYNYSANSLLAHRTALNIDRLNNTSDAEKPISTATATALSGKAASIHSHTSSDITDFSSAVSALAAVKSVNTRVGDIILSKSDVGLSNVDNTSDANKPISGATQTALNAKVDVVTGKGLSDENYTSAEKSKLSGIAAGAEVNVNADWSATSGDAQILNKPSTVAGYNITDAVATSGAQHIDGVKTFSSSPLVPNLTVGSSSSAAVNKAYVDNVASGIHVHAEVHVILKNTTLAAASGGTVAYTNGNSGVGAKLTITGGLTAVAALNAACGTDPDLAIGSRVIIAGETDAAWNGIYTISATRELTRATDADTPSKMNGGDFVFVTHGTIHADTGWICSEPVTIVGSSPVIFVQFSGSGAYDVGNGLQRDGTLFSVKTPVGGAIVADSNGINLGASGVTPNTYGSSTQSAVVTVNDKGLVTSVSSSTITPAVGSITGLGTGVGTFLGIPSSANLAAAVTGATGSGALVFGTTPTLSSPTISTAITFNATTYSYGTNAASAHRTALGLGTAAITDSSAYATSSHGHGNITAAGAIGTTSDQVVTTTTNGLLTTSSRNSIDSRNTFPNADVTAATSFATSSTLVRRDASANASFNAINIGSAANTGNYIFTRTFEDYIGDDPVTYNPTVVLTPGIAYNSNTTTITLPARNGTALLDDEVSVTATNNKIVKRNESGGIFATNITGTSVIINEGNLSFNREITVYNGDEEETANASVALTCVTPIDTNPITITFPAQTGTVALTSYINLSNMGGLGANVATFLATPTSAHLAAAVVTDKTGSGALVFGTSPTLVTPNIGAATGERLTLTRTATTGTREEIFRASVSDATNDLFFVGNGTIVDGRFAPVFGGMMNTSATNWSLGFNGFVSSSNDASDSSNFGLIDFATFRSSSTTDPLNGTLSDVVNRKLFTWRTFNTTHMTMLANGNLGIGTTTPSQRLTVSGNVSATGNVSAVNATFSGHLAAATKSFKIPHQTKDGYLQYGVVESNEHSVYVRDKTTADTIILPDHWDWLVDSDSVTVSLTPYGSHQPLYIISADNKKVVVGGVTGEYHYVVYGTRQDVEALVVETIE
jgi:hypothetical protein